MVGQVVAYKYQLHVLQDCPPHECTAQTLTAYRFVYVPDDKNESVLPQGKKNPQRFFEADEQDKCGLMGISIWTTVPKAKRKYKSMGKRYDVRTLFGTHISALAITPTHGVVTKPSGSGHMDLHEFAGCDLSLIATVVEAL